MKNSTNRKALVSTPLLYFWSLIFISIQQNLAFKTVLFPKNALQLPSLSFWRPSYHLNIQESSIRPISLLNNDSKFKSGLLSNVILSISSGLSFDDGYQILISAQKPLGLVLEERDDGVGGCLVTDIDENGSAYKGGVRVGDWLVAVQNADVCFSPIEEILNRIGNAPRVVNLRFQRNEDPCL